MLPTRSILTCKITSLTHKSWNDLFLFENSVDVRKNRRFTSPRGVQGNITYPMKGRILVMQWFSRAPYALLASTKSSKILSMFTWKISAVRWMRKKEWYETRRDEIIEIIRTYLCGFRYNIGSQFHFNAPFRSSSDGNIKKDNRKICHVSVAAVLEQTKGLVSVSLLNLISHGQNSAAYSAVVEICGCRSKSWKMS